jgi:uncharacterized membrane protein YcgQ (UPF0703/DUF1980 family)
METQIFHHSKIIIFQKFSKKILQYIIYLYNILGFVRLWFVVVVLSIHPSRHLSSSVLSSVHPSSSSRKKKMMEREDDDDSWRRDLIVQHVRTQSLASVISAKSIQTFGGEIASTEQYTCQDPQPMNKAKMRNALERNKLE